ncbi:hypothetical protein P691DRAFT_805908, partial [Macrolepiota fuliginosa MF-IS2]
WARPEKDMNVVDYGEEYGGNEKEGQGEGAVSEHQPGRRSVDTASPQQRIGSPHDLENNAGDNPSREVTEYKRVWDRLNEWWRGVWSGQLDTGLLWTRPRVSEDSGATAVAVV